MMQSISTLFRLSANHADKQVMISVLGQNSGNAQISDVSDVKTVKILLEFLIDQKR